MVSNETKKKHFDYIIKLGSDSLIQKAVHYKKKIFLKPTDFLKVKELKFKVKNLR